MHSSRLALLLLVAILAALSLLRGRLQAPGPAAGTAATSPHAPTAPGRVRPVPIPEARAAKPVYPWGERALDARPDSIPDTRAAAEALLAPCIGLPAREVAHRLGLGTTERLWSDEPPATLRGCLYVLGDRRAVTLYVAGGEPLFRAFNERREWDYGMFLGCRVGGIQYESGDLHVDIGPAVPWQFRR